MPATSRSRRKARRQAAAEALIDYVIGDTYGVLLGSEVGYRTASSAAIANMDAELRETLAVEDPMGYLAGAAWFLTPHDPDAYQEAWDRVLNA